MRAIFPTFNTSQPEIIDYFDLTHQREVIIDVGRYTSPVTYLIEVCATLQIA